MQTQGDMIRVPTQALDDALKKVHIAIHPSDVLRQPPPGYTRIARNALSLILDALEQADAVTEAFYGSHVEVVQAHDPHHQPVLWKQFQHLKADRFVPLKALYNKDGKLLTRPEDVAEEVRSTRPFWNQQPAEVPRELMRTLASYRASTRRIGAIAPPSVDDWQR